MTRCRPAAGTTAAPGQGYAGEAARAVFAYLLGLGMQERGVVQLPGVDSPSRLYATPGATDVG
ncbi:hypothetical protein [Stenotrophomonas pavanii]|uniref:hypothetical protein n=1 Tax=Stenotrophomonas pavanii TaxID=487698 RepID=UPI001F0D0335|nr:hypothetical protein [Stenotrophomonas pavanii]